MLQCTYAILVVLASLPVAVQSSGFDPFLVSDRIIPVKDLSAVRETIQKAYFEQVREDKSLAEAHKTGTIRFRDKEMRYSFSRKGKPGANGYPLFIGLHGGGGAPARLNDSQWDHMKRYYLDSVKSGIYMAPRGVTNSWNLHFVEESYPLYDSLIELMIARENVDPNRVYLTGFSAGGDGVYQITPRMADRWAAVNMSAGHHNGVSPRNLYHVPFLIQLGQNDSAYKRNTEAVKFSVKLKKLQDREGGGYPHETNIHVGRGHNFPDNHPGEPDQAVLEDPATMLEGGKSKVVKRNTNAIAWMKTRIRTPLPERVIWDLDTRAKLRKGERAHRHYWVGISGEPPSGSEVIVGFNKKENQFRVESAVDGTLIFVSSKLADFSRPVGVVLEKQKFEFAPEAKVRVLAETIEERGDPNYMFEMRLLLKKTGRTWSCIEDVLAKTE